MQAHKLYKRMQDRRIEYLTYRGASLDEQGNLLWAKEELETWDEAFNEAMAMVKEYL